MCCSLGGLQLGELEVELEWRLKFEVEDDEVVL